MIIIEKRTTFSLSKTFTNEEVLKLFNDFKTILISEEYCLDQGRETPHYASVIKYIGQKI